MNVGTTLSAIAATVAAALAAINLYVSGRRENTRWIRKILVDAYTRLSANESRERMVRAARASMKLGGAVAEIRDASDPSAEAAVWH